MRKINCMLPICEKCLINAMKLIVFRIIVHKTAKQR